MLRSLPVVLVIRYGNDVIRFLRFRVPVRFGGRPDGRFGPWRAAVRPHPWLEKTSTPICLSLYYYEYY